MTTTTYLTCAQTAKLLRAALKAAFPGQKFSVRSDTYSGGASIRVRYTDGPFLTDVEDVAKQFAGARFDGMIDLKYGAAHYLLPDGTIQLARVYGHGMGNDADFGPPPEGATEVHFGADFVFVDRDLSPEFKALLKVKGQEVLDNAHGWQDCTMDDTYWPYGSIPTRYADYCIPAFGPDSLIRALAERIAPDGTERSD